VESLPIFARNFISSTSNPSLPLSCRVHVLDPSNASSYM
jgi:hypothetical protein